MKNWAWLLIPLLLTSFACSVAARDSQANQDTRPIVEENQLRIVFLAPASGSRFALGAWVLLYAEALDTGAGVAKIEFYDSFDAVIGTVEATNPQGDRRLTALFPWQPTTVQIHLIKAKAFRADGTPSNTAEVTIEVALSQSGTQLPPPAQPTSDLTQTPPASPQAAVTQDAAAAQPTAPAAGAGGGEAPQVPVTLQAVVSAEALNVRVAPNTTAAIAASALTTGTRIQLVGRSQDGLWYATPLAAGGVGWVFAEALTVEGDPATLPLAAAP